MLEIINTDYQSSNMPIIKVIGVGGCGNNAINRLAHQTPYPIQFIAINTDQMVLDRSGADTCITIGKKITGGFGAGGNPEIAYAAAEESADEIKEIVNDANMVILTAGMGGGTGTGALPYIAKICKDLGILTVAVVTTPFSFENTNRSDVAHAGIQKLEKCVDTLLVISNDKLLTSNEKIVTMSSAFTLADSVLKNSIDTITNIVFNCGTVNLDFNDLKTVLGDKGYGHLGIGYADENTSITDAIKQAINSPLLNTNLSGAKYVMINSSGDVNLVELNNAIRYIQEIVGTDAKIMWGTVSSKEQLDDNKNSLITIIATGLDGTYDPNRISLKNCSVKSTHDPVKTSSAINDLLAKSEKKENELVIPTFLQSRMRK
ncbi:MAG: cell division protein FtsZ [Eubacteriales bacterium]|nr:cell division protein FtsZ [Eubacteriales bacterium]